MFWQCERPEGLCEEPAGSALGDGWGQGGGSGSQAAASGQGPWPLERTLRSAERRPCCERKEGEGLTALPHPLRVGAALTSTDPTAGHITHSVHIVKGNLVPATPPPIPSTPPPLSLSLSKATRCPCRQVPGSLGQTSARGLRQAQAERGGWISIGKSIIYAHSSSRARPGTPLLRARRRSRKAGPRGKPGVTKGWGRSAMKP